MSVSILLLAAALLLAPIAAQAQSVVEQKECPNRKDGKAPDGYFGGSQKLTYESRVEDGNDANSKRFVRCIENLSNVTMWTDWRGLLSSNDVPPGHRLYGYVQLTGRNNEPKFTDLWWGDNRDKKVRVEAKCYQGEDACSSSGTFLDQFIIRSAHAQKGVPSLIELIERHRSVVLSIYQDVYVRHPDPRQRTPIKLALTARSELSRSDQPLVFYVLGSANAPWRELPSLLVRFGVGSQALFDKGEMEFSVPSDRLLMSSQGRTPLSFATAKPPGDPAAKRIRTVFARVSFRGADKVPPSIVPLTVFASSR